MEYLFVWFSPIWVFMQLSVFVQAFLLFDYTHFVILVRKLIP